MKNHAHGTHAEAWYENRPSSRAGRVQALKIDPKPAHEMDRRSDRNSSKRDAAGWPTTP
jgi:hypothetical protein